MKISDISVDISDTISAMFDTISVIYPNRRYIGFRPIYRENIMSVAHAR